MFFFTFSSRKETVCWIYSLGILLAIMSGIILKAHLSLTLKKHLLFFAADNYPKDYGNSMQFPVFSKVALN